MILRLEELIELLDELRLAGYDIGTEQYVSVQNLLLALAARGPLPANSDLSTWLAPLLCSSPKEQDHFYKHYDQWLKRHPQLLPDSSGEQLSPTEKVSPARAIARKARRSAFRLRVLLPLALILMVAGVAVGLYIPFFPRTLSGRIMDAKEKRPLRGATIDFAGRTTTTDQSGQFTLTYRRKNATASVVASLSATHAPNAVPFQGGRLRRHDNLGDISLAPVGPPDTLPNLTSELTGTPDQLPTTTNNQGFFSRHFKLIRAIVVALPLLVFMAWWLWRVFRRRMLLQKLTTAGDPHLKRIVVKGAAAHLFRGQSFRRLAQELRRHRRRVSAEVDPQLTVQATVQKGGLFVPFYAARKTLPEYLALVDRASPRDQQARLQDELLSRLVEDNVFVDRYYYNEDPRICRTDGGRASFVSLQDLASRHPEHQLVMFGDGSGLVDPLTGEPEHWVEMLSPWTQRALLTPESPAQWSYREWSLAELDFSVLPASTDGLAALVEILNSGAPPKTDNASTPAFPTSLRENSQRWLERHETNSSATDRLCNELRNYLGEEEFHWLCATAVYPTLSWDLTLYFGYKLLKDREHFEKKLSSLVRLPWFRYGDIPNWLRKQLVSAMAPEQEKAVRQVLNDMLISLMENPTEGISLEIAPRSKEGGPRGWRRFPYALKTRWQKWKSQGKLRRFFRAIPEESPLHDYVFLSFMSGRKPRKLDVSVPAVLRRILYPQGQPALGLRSATVLAFALMISLAGFMALNTTRPKTQTPETEPPKPTPTISVIVTDPSSPSPSAGPTVDPRDSGETIATVPNGAKVIVELNWNRLDSDRLGVRLEQSKVTGGSTKIASRTVRVTSSTESISFSDLPAGNFQIFYWLIPSSGVGKSAGFVLTERQALVVSIPGFYDGPTISAPDEESNTREAPDNSYIVTSGSRETRYFRNSPCKSTVVISGPTATSSGLLRGEIILSDGRSQVREMGTENASMLLRSTCSEIIAFHFPKPTPTPTPTPPSGSAKVLIDTWNTDGVWSTWQGKPASFRIDRPHFITLIQNYHWNAGQGSVPGTIGLRGGDGKSYGPWSVTARPGVGNAPNVDWVCTPNVWIPAGTYIVVDSNTGTWSTNPRAGGLGMSRVAGIAAN